MLKYLYIFKAIQIAGTISAWSVRALEDNKITLTEAVELAETLAPILGVKTEIVIPLPKAPEKPPPETDEEAPPETAEEEPPPMPVY